MRFLSNIFLVLSLHLTFVLTFSVNFPATATEGQSFSISFSGNDATTPFQLLLLPFSSGAPTVIDIPDNAWSQGSSTGSFTTNVPFIAGTRFLAVLQDRKGRGTGVVSDIISTARAAGAVCRRPQPPADIFSVLPSNPRQCAIDTISWIIPSNRLPRGGGAYAVNITTYIPRGQPFVLGSVISSAARGSAQWTTNVVSGTRFLFLHEYDAGDGNIIRQTGPLQTSQIPAAGAQNCLGIASPGLVVDGSVAASNSGGGGISSNDRLLLIAIGVGVFGVVLVVGAVGIFIYRRRLQRLIAKEGPASGSPTRSTPAMKSVGATSPSSRTTNGDPFSDKNAIGSNRSNMSNNLTSPNTYKSSNAYNVLNRSNTTATSNTSGSNQSNFLTTMRPGRRALLSIASFGNRGSLPASRRNSLTAIGIGEPGATTNNGRGGPDRNREYDANGNRTNVRVAYLDLDKDKPYTTYTKRPNRI